MRAGDRPDDDADARGAETHVEPRCRARRVGLGGRGGSCGVSGAWRSRPLRRLAESERDHAHLALDEQHARRRARAVRLGDDRVVARVHLARRRERLGRDRDAVDRDARLRSAAPG